MGRTASREKGEETEMKQAETGVGQGGSSEVQDQSQEKSRRDGAHFSHSICISWVLLCGTELIGVGLGDVLTSFFP